MVLDLRRQEMRMVEKCYSISRIDFPRKILNVEILHIGISVSDFYAADQKCFQIFAIINKAVVVRMPGLRELLRVLHK